MKPIVPFVSEANEDERKAWSTALPTALKDIAEVKAFSTLSEQERSRATVAIVANPDPAKVAAMPNLVWVQSLWAGVERLTAELPQDGPLIVRLTDPQMAETMSEAVLAWSLYLHRDMPKYMTQQRQRVWLGHELLLPAHRTIAILGLGKLGIASARRLKSNGFNVIGWSRSEKSLDDIRTYCGQDGLEAVLKQADSLVLLMPLTDETRGLLDSTAFEHCKPGATVINFARGPIIETPALIAALDRGQLSHAVLDVFDSEPLPPESPLWSNSNVTILPHISAPTITSTAPQIVADNIRHFFQTGCLPESVDRKKGY
ncbi:glyoxylate/hydroxypyruvate reductase A [uncultured Roseibium sp.]|uniref:2-hydroxyacid dehydrogenase n=1 Tax=uncultured Roseibium sp. TaxID=1936171 RepID=UPI002638898E|nr:glyoxylate/hydroxypyruvate reductase A [uncultured Roseibium sp.]